jgi:hypothetical protein
MVGYKADYFCSEKERPTPKSPPRRGLLHELDLLKGLLEIRCRKVSAK